MTLTFTQFVQNLIDTFDIAPSMFHLVLPGSKFPYNRKLGWHFSDDVSYCDYEAVLIVADNDKGITNGGIIQYSHKNGYRINYRGVAEQLTLDEVAEMFGKPVPGSLGLPISPLKGTFKSNVASHESS